MVMLFDKRIISVVAILVLMTALVYLFTTFRLFPTGRRLVLNNASFVTTTVVQDRLQSPVKVSSSSVNVAEIVSSTFAL